MVMMRVRILNLFSKPLCVSSCCVMTLRLPGVTGDKSSYESLFIRNRSIRWSPLPESVINLFDCKLWEHYVEVVGILI
jgi:hypothetical protein